MAISLREDPCANLTRQHVASVHSSETGGYRFGVDHLPSVKANPFNLNARAEGRSEVGSGSARTCSRRQFECLHGNAGGAEERSSRWTGISDHQLNGVHMEYRFFEGR